MKEQESLFTKLNSHWICRKAFWNFLEMTKTNGDIVPPRGESLAFKEIEKNQTGSKEVEVISTFHNILLSIP